MQYNKAFNSNGDNGRYPKNMHHTVDKWIKLFLMFPLIDAAIHPSDCIAFLHRPSLAVGNAVQVYHTLQWQEGLVLFTI